MFQIESPLKRGKLQNVTMVICEFSLIMTQKFKKLTYSFGFSEVFWQGIVKQILKKVIIVRDCLQNLLLILIEFKLID